MFEVHKRSRLPHWRANVPYFVTFNLFDAIPEEVHERLTLERRIRIAELERLRQRATPAEIAEIDRLIRERAEDTLDEGLGSCFMRDARIAKIVADAICYFDQERYALYAWCVMPNHVHVVFEAVVPIDSVIQSWKSFTSKEANRILHREGKFWQDDYFDHSIRSREELDRTIRYVLDNPLKAGLKDWLWLGERASRPVRCR